MPEAVPVALANHAGVDECRLADDCDAVAVVLAEVEVAWVGHHWGHSCEVEQFMAAGRSLRFPGS